MLPTIFVVLLFLLLWLLGIATSVTAGGLIHLLPVIALVVLAARLVGGARRLA